MHDLTVKGLRLKYPRSYCSGKCYPSLIKYGKLDCNCGEDIHAYEWHWQKEEESNNTVISNGDREVLFHPVYSSGTAAVRGNSPFKKNLHYYWEIKMISNLYGTDIMVGVGTSQVAPADWKLRFCSMLGWDKQSWGYSYQGRIQHNRMTRRYGLRFDLGSIIGIHLDMCAGTLEYYLNRKPLGVAFKRLKTHELYPMISSTAAQSGMRLCCAVSEKPTLQLMCLQVIRKHKQLLKSYRDIPGLARTLNDKYFWVVPKEIDAEPEKKPYRRELSLEDESVLSCVQSLASRRKRMRTVSQQTEPRADPDHMVYRLRDRIVNKRSSHFGDIATAGCSSTQETGKSRDADAQDAEMVYISDTDSDFSNPNIEQYCDRCNIRICEGEELQHLCISSSVLYTLSG